MSAVVTSSSSGNNIGGSRSHHVGETANLSLFAAVASSAPSAFRILCVVCGPFRPTILANHGDFSQLLRTAVDVLSSDADPESPQVIRDHFDSRTSPARPPASWELFHLYDAPVTVSTTTTTTRAAGDDAALTDAVLAQWPNLADYDAVILSGSRYNMTEDHPWLPLAAEWLRRAVREREAFYSHRCDGDVSTTRSQRPPPPILGICFGHQLLSHALGGAVDWNPAGRECGTLRIEQTSTLAPAASGPRDDAHADGNPHVLDNHDDVLVRVASLPAAFDVIAYHNQTVTCLPKTSVCLFRSVRDRHQVVRHGPLVYSVQFHPEFSPALMQDYAPHLSFESEQERTAFVDSLRDTPIAKRIVGAFIVLAWEERQQPHFRERRGGREATAK